MANILPVSDLRNYNEVLKNCHKGEPVYLTKNGRGCKLCLNGMPVPLLRNCYSIFNGTKYR